jgi:hypothetical protein
MDGKVGVQHTAEELLDELLPLDPKTGQSFQISANGRHLDNAVAAARKKGKGEGARRAEAPGGPHVAQSLLQQDDDPWEPRRLKEEWLFCFNPANCGEGRHTWQCQWRRDLHAKDYNFWPVIESKPKGNPWKAPDKVEKLKSNLKDIDIGELDCTGRKYVSAR